MKTVNLANVKISPKYFLWGIVAIVVLLAMYGVGRVIYGKLTAAISPVAGKITDTDGW